MSKRIIPFNPAADTLSLRWLALILLALFSFGAAAFAQQSEDDASPEIRVRASASQSRVYLGNPFELSIEVRGTNRVDPVDLSKLVSNLRIQYRSSGQGYSSNLIIRNGQRIRVENVSTTLVYSVTPMQAGEFTIPPIELTIEGQTYHTNPVTFHAIAPQHRTDVRAVAELDATEAFVGQPVTLTLHIDSMYRLLAVPMIVAPEQLNGARVFSLPKEKVSVNPDALRSAQPREVQIQMESSGNRRQDAYIDLWGAKAYLKARESPLPEGFSSRTTLRAAIVPTEPGVLTIEPIIIRVEVQVTAQHDSIMRIIAPSQVVILQTEPMTLTVNPLPPDPSPLAARSFDSVIDTPLVGRFQLNAHATPSTANVGDPIDFTLDLNGWEPLERLGRLDLAAVDGFDRRFRLATPSIASDRHGSAFRYSAQIRAADERANQIPALAFRAFDPIDREWKTYASTAVPLDIRATRVVRSGDVVSPDATQGGSTLQTLEHTNALGPIAVSPQLLDLQAFTLASVLRSPAVLAAVVLPPTLSIGAAMAVLISRRRAGRTKAVSHKSASAKALAALRAIPSDAAPADAAHAITAAIRQYLADRGMNASSPLPEALSSVLAECDAIRFGGGSVSVSQLIAQAQAAIASPTITP